MVALDGQLRAVFVTPGLLDWYKKKSKHKRALAQLAGDAADVPFGRDVPSEVLILHKKWPSSLDKLRIDTADGIAKHLLSAANLEMLRQGDLDGSDLFHTAAAVPVLLHLASCPLRTINWASLTVEHVDEMCCSGSNVLVIDECKGSTVHSLTFVPSSSDERKLLRLYVDKIRPVLCRGGRAQESLPDVEVSNSIFQLIICLL